MDIWSDKIRVVVIPAKDGIGPFDD